MAEVIQMQSGGNKALSFGKSRAKLTSAQGKKVTFVDVNAVLTTADLADGVHLTSTGYAKDGDAWFSALQPLLPPRPTPVPRTCPCTIWPTSVVPGTVQATWDTSPNELGVKFRSDVPGVDQRACAQ